MVEIVGERKNVCFSLNLGFNYLVYLTGQLNFPSLFLKWGQCGFLFMFFITVF